jgi:predicted transcriptional regulator
VLVGTWTCPADFGGERGVLTPLWWDNNNTQYGLLKVWRVNNQGSFVDGIRVSNICLNDLHIESSKIIEVRIGIREDAKSIGGINLFGSKFGNYPQDLLMTQRYRLGA